MNLDIHIMLPYWYSVSNEKTISMASIGHNFDFLVASRFLGNNYDNLTHLHPDERWLVMVAGKLHFFDRLDPDFFAYGSLPIYTLKALAQSSDALLHRIRFIRRAACIG